MASIDKGRDSTGAAQRWVVRCIRSQYWRKGETQCSRKDDGGMVKGKVRRAR